MLVLQRKKHESILINENIEVSVLEIGADWVKLAISAPKDVSILRAELKEVAAANRDSADAASITILKKIMNQES